MKSLIGKIKYKKLKFFEEVKLEEISLTEDYIKVNTCEKKLILPGVKNKNILFIEYNKNFSELLKINYKENSFYLGVYFDEPMKKGKDSYCGNPKFYVWNGNGSFGFLKDNVSLFENSEINDFLQKLLDKPLVGIPKRDFNSYLKNIKN